MPPSNYDRYYYILDLQPGATLAEVQDAWRLLSQIWHPDRQQPGTKAYAKALEKQKQINDAYDCLKSVLQNAQKAPPPNAPPPPPADSSGKGSPPNWKWPPPRADATGSQWQQSAFAQAVAQKLMPLFDLGEYGGKAVYDSATGTLDYLPYSKLEIIRQHGLTISFALFCLFTVLGVAYYLELAANLLLPGVEGNISILIIGWFLTCLIVQVWATRQGLIYQATERPLLELYHLSEREAVAVISKCLSDFTLKDYVLGPTSIEHKGEAAIFKAPLTGSDANKKAKLILQGEIYPLSQAALIRFKIVVQSPGAQSKLGDLIELLFPLLTGRLKRASKDNLKAKGGNQN